MRTPIRACALVVAMMSAASACAQYAASVDVASRNRYRGTDLGDTGPLVRLNLMVDATANLLDGAYAGVSAAWHARNAELETAEALVGWSGRFRQTTAFSALDPRWGWDAGIHLLHYGGTPRYDFHEFMIGLLAPGGSARIWWSPHYFGGSRASLYGGVDASTDLADRWRLFGHVGLLRYGDGGSGPRPPSRVDGLVGIGHAVGMWDARLAFDGRISIGARNSSDSRQGRFACVFSGGLTF